MKHRPGIPGSMAAMAIATAAVWVLSLVGLAECGRPLVTNVEPNEIGWGGGVITVHGVGFSEDVFNQFDDTKGNKIWFSNEYGSVKCQTPIASTFLLENPQDPSTKKITCDLPARPGLLGSDWFNLKLMVDNEEVSNGHHFSVLYKDRFTPKIRNILPRYGLPGDKMNIIGRIFTKEYGNANFGDEGSVNDRREQSITAVQVGERECELTDELGNVHGIYVNDNDEGNITCIPGGSFIGPLKVKVFISDKYGKSIVTDDGYSINSKNQIFNYHTLPEVTKISQASGASSGGTQLQIEGNSFDKLTTEVFIGETECKTGMVENRIMTCTTPPEIDVLQSKLGPRGLLYEIWTSTEGDLADFSSLQTNAGDYQSFINDNSSIKGPYFDETKGFSARLSGFFVAPYTGKISFYLESSDKAKLRLSTDKNPDNLRDIVEHEAANNNLELGQPHSEPVDVVKGKAYYMEATHVQQASSEEANILAIHFWEHNTNYHKSHSNKALDEKQRIHMRYRRKIETQEVKFENVAEDMEITLTHAGKLAKAPITLSGRDMMNETLKNMFTYTCRYSKNVQQKISFEDGEEMFHGTWGSRRKNVEPFCGVKSLENQKILFHSHHHKHKDHDPKRDNWVCFAARGKSLSGSVALLAHHKVDRWMKWTWFHTEKVWEPSDKWSHQCVDMYEFLLNKTEDKNVKIREIQLNLDFTGDNFYVDDVTLSPFKIEITREAPALPVEKTIVSDVFLIEDESNAGTFEVQFMEETCNSEEDDLSLLGVKDAVIEGLNVDGMSDQEKMAAEVEYLKTNQIVTFTKSDWGTGKITVTRKETGSRALTGNFELSYNGKTIPLKPHPDNLILEKVLSNLGMIGATVSQPHAECYNTLLDIDFAYSLTGDLEPIEIDATNITVDGDRPDFKVESLRNGGIMVKHPGGDFFRTVSSGLSVNVFVNGYLSSCTGSCLYSYDATMNPTVTSVTETVEDGNVYLIIDGTNLSPKSYENIVMVGHLSCDVIESTETSLKCRLQPGEAGTYEVTVIVSKAGKAEGHLSHEIGLQIFEISPDSGSLGGGTPILVKGSGFPNSLDSWQTGSVTIGGSECKVTKTNFANFTCITSPHAGGVEDIIISIGGKTTTGGSFNYDSSNTPTVTALSITESTPMGGEELVISGTKLGLDESLKIKVGNAECKTKSWKPTEIKCILPGNPTGTYPVQVPIKNNGFADVKQVDGISYSFFVNKMSPSVGSLMGNTTVAIEGGGFGDCSHVDVKFGELFKCPIINCTDTKIICITERIPKIHKITNSGRHQKAGVGYVWSDLNLVINPGDVVAWTWNLMVSSDDTKISVHQVDDESSVEYNGNGFKSMKAASGRFSQTFSKLGKYYYSSERVGKNSIYLKGEVKVALEEKSEESELSVSMNNIEATQTITSDPSTLDFGACTLEAGASCTPNPVPTDVYIFKADPCLTPTVSEVKIVEGSYNESSTDIDVFGDAVLSLTGTGFSTNKCQNHVDIGGSTCKVQTSSETEVTCVVDGSDVNLKSLSKQKISYVNLNNGKSVMQVAGTSTEAVLRIMPSVETVNTNSGSWAGGNIYKIIGKGLLPEGGNETIIIRFGDMSPKSCKIVKASYSSVFCLVPSFTDVKEDQSLNTKSVPVSIQLGYDSHIPKMTDLSYEYTDTKTPTVSSIDKNSGKLNDTLQIEGTNLKDGTKIYLRKKGTSKRIRRSLYFERPSVTEILVDEPLVRVKRDDSIFLDNPTWMSSKGFIEHEDLLTTMDPGSSRAKRSTEEEDQEWIEAQLEAKKNIASLNQKICETDEVRCYDIDIPSNPENVYRVKRSTDEGLLEVSLGELYEAQVVDTTATSISFRIPLVSAGDYDIILYNPDEGNAAGNVGTVRSNIDIASISPNSGSIHGGLKIEITGSGFCTAEASVKIGVNKCDVKSITTDSIICITPEGTDGAQDVSIGTCGVTATSSFEYSASQSPDVSRVLPPSMKGEGDITIEGKNFGTDPEVWVGKHACLIKAKSETSITCTLKGLAGGKYDIKVDNPNKGYSNTDKQFESILEVTSVTPSSGSFGGGTPMTIVGSGFDDIEIPVIKLCDEVCAITEISSTKITCRSPAQNLTGSIKSCDFSLKQASGENTGQYTYEYDPAKTPMVATVNPKRGGTGGGTKITVTGSGFASNGNIVKIDGVICDIKDASDESESSITCYTNHHDGAIESYVVVEVPDKGYAGYDNKTNAAFYYIDRWSSIWTWGGKGTPAPGQFVVITPGQVILLDTDTPVLKFLLIKGGTLMFDRELSKVELNSEFILLVEGGKLEIGTKDEPYESNAIITMHGNVRCTELPIFGCKVIGVRNGTLDFHGQHVPITWTHLAETVEAGSDTIKLMLPVTWKADDSIALATTSDRNSMKENEEHVIKEVSADGLKITLVEPVKYRHISIEQDFDGNLSPPVQTRGEVALLTRNIHIKGSMNEQFLEVLPACEEEFSSGVAFGDGKQTCFSGKFGEELGSDEMGAIIIISPKYKDQFLVTARIEYTEFSNVGQAFRVGRYPIHFHLPGNMSGSYIRGNAIHHSNNRACTLHDVSNLMVEHNVAYNIKGLSFFLEDGVEEYNTLQYNLAVFTRMSNSLLNPDVNPASFWIVNPNNKFIHNSCAGGTHFCFWLRPAKVPDGPSYTRHYCPYKVPFDEFYNNTAHSMGWYGFWIFGQSNHANYDPHDGSLEDHGYCRGRRIQTTIGSFTTWNNKRGFEIVSGANIRLENQIHMDHDFAGFEIFTAKGPYGSGGPGIHNSVLVGHSKISELTKAGKNACTPGGIHGPDSAYTIENVKFFNFDRDCYALYMRLEESGATVSATRISGVEFFNSPNKVLLDKGEDHGLWYYDVDGSLTGTPESHLVGNSETNPKGLCNTDQTGDLGKAHHLDGQPGSICPADSVKFHRVMMKGENSPYALKYNAVNLTNSHGTSIRPWGKMVGGWSALLPEKDINWMVFDSSEHVTNISYHIKVSGIEKEGDHVIIGHQVYQQPDSFLITTQHSKVNETDLTEYPTYENTEISGQWYFKENETAEELNKMVYILSDKKPSRLKRWAEEGSTDKWIDADFSVIKCYFDGCLPPPPATLPPGRPAVFLKWSSDDDWKSIEKTMPKAGESVELPPGVWMVMDVSPPPLKQLSIYGALEIADEGNPLELKVEILLLQGETSKFQCGTPDEPFQSNFDLILLGNHRTETLSVSSHLNVGAKAMGIFGFFDMHGKEVSSVFEKISEEIPAGSKQITLAEPVAWEVGSEIVISATSYELKETEKRKIVNIASNVITVDEPLKFDHSCSKRVDGLDINLCGEVGLLTRNVRIRGDVHAEMEDELFGGRVLVGSFEQDGTTYTGYARFSNVEFEQAGQEGWFDSFDPRYALAFMELGDLIDGEGKANAKESWVKKCSFNYVYNSAIGIFGSNNIPVEDNVIYRFINDGILDESEGTKIIGNLVTMGESLARIKMQSMNPEFHGCINIKSGKKTTLSNNIMAGCAQAGLKTMGSPCSEEFKLGNNEMHTTSHGIHLDSYGTSMPSSKCVKLDNQMVWKNYDYGIMTKSESSIELSNIVAVDNGAAFLPSVYGPSAVKHEVEEKYITLEHSYIVGVSDGHDCNKEELPDIYKAPMEKKRKWRGRWGERLHDGKNVHHTGIVWPIFQSKYGKNDHPWHQPVKGATGTYPALRGILNLNNITFSSFGEKCESKDIVFRTNNGEDDMNWPIKAKNIQYKSVEDKNKIYIDLPLDSKINPSDCVDMDCDGMRKAMIMDTDGSLSGKQGTIIPDTSYEWDQNPARGLGYFRVPKSLITTLAGDKIPYEDIMPNIGIYRDSSCNYNEDWRAFSCANINHRIMIIESLDRDTLIRRLSPIAVLADRGTNGYIDLVNGPQDHSCCAGYICAERISTFYTMVATGKDYEIHFTSVPPQNFKLHLLHNEDSDEAVRLKIYFPKQQRLDIYEGEEYINPNNIDTTKPGEYSLVRPSDDHIPAITERNGANFFDPRTGHLHVILKGNTLEIKTQPVVVLKMQLDSSLPSVVDIENFFEQNVVGNLAGLLGIDPKMIMVTEIVRESNRKKRDAGTSSFGATLNIETDTNRNRSENTPVDFEEVEKIESKLVTAALTNQIVSSDSSAVSFSGLNIEKAVKEPVAPVLNLTSEERQAVGGKTFAEKNQEADEALREEYSEVKIEAPEQIRLFSKTDIVKEMEKFEIIVYLATGKGSLVGIAGGSGGDPWTCKLSKVSGTGDIDGTREVNVDKGYAIFDDIALTKKGSDYVLKFDLTPPNSTPLTSLIIDTIEVEDRPLNLKEEKQNVVIPQNKTFSIDINIWDAALDSKAEKSTLAQIEWTCRLSFLKGQNVNATIDGTLELTVEAGNPMVVFDDLVIDTPGLNYRLSTECVSTAYETINLVSAPFHVYPTPQLEVDEEAVIKFNFEGPLANIWNLTKALNPLVSDMKCENCPSTEAKLVKVPKDLKINCPWTK